MDNDLELWKKWKASRSPFDLSQLLRSFNPLIQNAVNKYSNAPVPRSALEAEAKKWAVEAFKTFNPNKGVKLSTHVTNYMMKLYRYTGKYQNVARIPEHQIMQIRPFQSAENQLTDNLGRPPTTHELSEHLGWSDSRVKQMQSSIRKDIAFTTGMGDGDQTSYSKEGEILAMGYWSLTNEEKLVYDYTTGSNGKPKLKPGEIARRMKVSPSKVSKIRNSIGTKLNNFLSG